MSEQGRLMDAGQIMRELGVTRAAADRIIRWCHEQDGSLRPVDGARKLYVGRESVERWLELSRNAA